MEVLEDAGAPNLHLTSLSPSALAEQIDQEQAGLGIYHRAVPVMRIYDFFFIFLSIRDPSHPYDVLFNSGWALVMLTLNGLAFHIYDLWPRAAWWANNSLLFFFWFSCGWAVQCSRSVLDTAQHMPSFDIPLRALIALAVLGMACALLTPHDVGVRLTTLSV